MRRGGLGSWRVRAAAAAGILPILTLGVLITQFHARSASAAGVPGAAIHSGPAPRVARGDAAARASGVDRAPARAGDRVAAGVPARQAVFVAGREVLVPRWSPTLTVSGVHVAVPRPDPAQGLAYVPLRLSPHADLRSVWERSAPALEAAWPGPKPDPLRARRRTVRTPSVLAEQTSSSAPSAPPPVVYRGAVPYTESDLLLVAHVVHSEADGQPWDAQVGVAAVIVNRLRAPGFPKTIWGVVYQPGQFDGVDAPLFYATPSQEDVQAATAALQGQDPTGGALHFYNPAMTWAGSPIFDFTVLATYGALRFAR